MDIIYVIIGLVLLFFGGEALLRGSVALARRFGMSDLLVGAVVVGFGTSMPELTVSVDAALGGAPEIALGNVVGSNIANILLILGICAIIFPVRTSDRAVMRDALMVLGSSALLAALAVIGTLTAWAAGGFLAILIGYIVWCYRLDRARVTAAEELHAVQAREDTVGTKLLSPLWAGLACLGGLALLIGGARLLVLGATALAREAGISEAVIGLTLVAVGTSLPELATGVVAAWRKHGDVIIGNILGSNLFNTLGILGVTGLITDMPITGQIARIDVWIMLGTAALLLPIIRSGHRISRAEGGAMLAAYIAYVAWLYLGASA